MAFSPPPDDGKMHAVVKRASHAVYRALGPGMAEVVYRNALCLELQSALQLLGMQLAVAMEVVRPITYRGTHIGFHRHDIVVGNCVIEIKVGKTSGSPQYEAQVQRYRRHIHPAECLVLVVFGTASVTTAIHPGTT